MADSSVYSVKSYRDYLNQKVEKGARGLASRLAEAGQCQNSHISRVLAGELHLTMEQAFRISRFLNLSSAEENFFLKLVERDRCGDHIYKNKLDTELTELRREQEDLGSRFKQKEIHSELQQMTYYSAWYWSAIHIATSIPALQTPAAIAKKLNLDESFVRDCLEKLESFGLVSSKGGVRVASGSIHLTKQSPMNAQQHANWRSRAVLDSQSPQHDGVHYTIVQSVSSSDYLKIKQMILKTIDDYASIATPSKEEELICLTCDFFKV